MEYQSHLYQILYPKNALVASQLSWEDFARHYQIGSHKHYSGKVIFSEIDVNYRNDYFNIDEILDNLAPHPDGKPKATKYICSYRVMEHIDLDAMKSIYLVNTNGTAFELNAGELPEEASRGLRMYAQICPLSVLTLSTYTPSEYADLITKPNSSKGAPKILFTQIDVDLEQFQKDYNSNSFISAPFSFLHPSKLNGAIQEIQNSGGKKPVKGIALTSDINNMSYRNLLKGFCLSSQEKNIFFPIPSLKEIQKKDLRFYKSM